jgi:GH15 family glucan-1,4-alpha-glucosidase
MALKIEDYGLIGNLRTAALVSRNGSVDWACAPAFDSDAFFASMVGYDQHGRWSLRPATAVRRIRQRYREDSLILETEFACDGGLLKVVDFMPIAGAMGASYGDRCDIVRIVEAVDGEVPLEMLLNVRFGYGAYLPLIQPAPQGACFIAGPDAVTLRSDARLTLTDEQACAYVTVKKGERLSFTLTWHESRLDCPPAVDATKALGDTERFWKQWSGRCTYQGHARDAVMRSLITLKALTYAPTGAIVAAPTTSLPEEIGGVRNYDYRYCWLRDSSLTLNALMAGGYVEEASAFRDWLLRAVAGAPEELQIMYDIHGGRRLKEFELDWLPGYEGSKPVRVGNAASGQFQLDVYGETLSCFYLGRRMGLPAASEGWRSLAKLIAFMERAWQRPDEGIWEVRGGQRHFTHSKVMAWVAIDRAVRSIEEHGLGADEGRAMLPRLRTLRERIHEEVCERGFNPRIGAFSQYYGSDALDASCLLIPHFGFLPADDPRVQATVAAIEKRLLRDGFVLRYATEAGIDGLPGTEGAFLACSFWLADNYAMAGRLGEAEKLFDRLLGLRNHLGLLAEEYEPRLQRQVGNFPQGFSHLALIVSAHAIEQAARQPQKRAKGAAVPA